MHCFFSLRGDERMFNRLDQYYHVSDKKIVLLFALMIINVLSAVLIQFINLLTQNSSDFWMVMIGGYLGYFCYFMMLAIYISVLKADRSLMLNEMISVAFKSLVFSLVFYISSAVLSYSAFTSLISGNSSIGSMAVSLLIMLFILFYIPYSLICLFEFDLSKNPLIILWHSFLILIKNVRKCLGVVCIFAVLEGSYIGISNLLFQTSLDFNPLVYVTEILTRTNPWAARLSMNHIMLFVLTMIYGILFAVVSFYGLYAVKEICENQ